MSCVYSCTSSLCSFEPSNKNFLLRFVSEEKSLGQLLHDANTRIKAAFHPKTRRCYELLFRLFIGFCLCSGVNVAFPTLSIVMAYLEFLVKNQVSVSIIANHRLWRPNL